MGVISGFQPQTAVAPRVEAPSLSGLGRGLTVREKPKLVIKSNVFLPGHDRAVFQENGEVHTGNAKCPQIRDIGPLSVIRRPWKTLFVRIELVSLESNESDRY